jgi:RNA polymerase sigma factor (sigma-70 family)
VETVLSTDSDLLAAIRMRKDADALGEIVSRYLPLVHSAAVRQVGLASADDVAQAVFLLLWQRPSKVRQAPLAGWLLKSTHLICCQVRRGDARRRRRELIAAGSRPSFTGDPMLNGENPLVPLLDEALAQLSESERAVIALQYLEQKPLAEVAEIVGVSDAAARKRASRGLDRLRKFFARRGVNVSGTALGIALAEHAGRSVPSGMLRDQIVTSILNGGIRPA